MKITLSKRIGLLAFLLPCALALSTTVHAETNKLVIESGDSAQSRQHAAMEKEQWNDTRNLRILCAAWTVELAALLPPNLLLI